jgi:trigger factor
LFQEEYCMAVTVETTGTNQAKLTITVEGEEYSAAMQRAYLIVKNRVNIPGFRKGKAPRPVIERFYSEAVFYDDACDIAIPEAYDKAVKEQELEPVERPRIEVLEIGADTGIKFTAEVTLKPVVGLGQYKGLAVKKAEYPVTGEDVEKELANARERVARWVEVDRPIENGDRISLDYLGTSEGVAFPGGTAENQPLEVGSGRFIPGFEEQLTGLAAGQEADIQVTFPEEYHAAELAGKPATFHVKIREVKGKELPELDDEFAKDVSEFDTLDEYSSDIRKHLEEESEHKASHEYEDKLIELATENAEVEIPQCMIDRRAERMAEEFEYRIAYQGIKIEEYMRMTGQTREDIVGRYKADAEKAVKMSLVMEAIRKAEEIEATDEEVDEELGKLAETRKQSVDDLKKTMGEEDKEYIRDNILIRKTLKLLEDNAGIGETQG